jgi:hypothetical protein
LAYVNYAQPAVAAELAFGFVFMIVFSSTADIVY